MVVGTKALGTSLGEAATGADLGASSKYSNIPCGTLTPDMMGISKDMIHHIDNIMYSNFNCILLLFSQLGLEFL